MKKIMFNDRFGLTQAVLDGRKTMTRRFLTQNYERVSCMNVNYEDHWHGELDGETFELLPRFQVGEIVAIAQNYKDAGYTPDLLQEGFFHQIGTNTPMEIRNTPEEYIGKWMECHFDELSGWSNKMFVLADLMPHHIRITGIKSERLQDISNEDAMREGVFKYDEPPLFHEFDPYSPWPPHVKPYKHDHDNKQYFCEARFAFAHLIERVSRIGMLNINPWVFAYSFERID